MFYSQSLLSKNGPLGTIWIASYCFKKLKKHQIAETDITSSVDKIIPQVQFSYRILGQLLLGIVRIYSKKVDYLYHDCNEALIIIAKALTPLKNSLTRPPHNVPARANAHRQHNVTANKESQNKVNHDEGNACSSKSETITVQVEAMCAPYHEVSITLPNCFELDAFDLGAEYRGETTEHHNESILADEWGKENDQHTILNEHHNMEGDDHFEDNYGCFSPMDDVTQSSALDFEINELCTSTNIVERHDVGDDDNHGSQQEQTASSSHSETQFDHLNDQVGPATPNHGKVSNEKAHGESDVCIDSGIQSPNPSVITHRKLQTPNFAVTTPARKDRRARPSYRKRKRNVNILFDETIVLSNETMQTWIYNASDLVCKRKKAPHTSLDVWKAHRFTCLPELFMEPVLPYISQEHKTILCNRMSVKSSQMISANLSSSINLQSMISDLDIDGCDSFASENPPPDNYIEICTPEKSERRRKEVAEGIPSTSSTLEMMDKGLCSADREASEQASGWSVRTRAVAKYLYERFLAFKEQKRNENLILNQILEGETKAKAARFFYETLTLKGFGCIDVEQATPYGDIIVSATPGLEAFVKQ